MSLHMVLVWTSSETCWAAANFAYFSVVFHHLCGLPAWSLFLSAISLPLSIWAEGSQALAVIISLFSFPLCILQPRNLSLRHAWDQSPLPLYSLYRKADIRRDETRTFIAWDYTNSVGTLCQRSPSLQTCHWFHEPATYSLPRSYPHCEEGELHCC